MSKKISRWADPEFRKKWNKEYRQRIKDNEIVPKKRSSEQTSKWNDREFRRQYDRDRKQRLRSQMRESKISEKIRPNHSKSMKEAILQDLIQQIKDGKEKPFHPFFELSIEYKPEAKRRKKTKED